MRMIVFFDLPTITKKDRKIANRFRRFLLKDGYVMLQLSVYGRLCNGLNQVEKHKLRLDKSIPQYGSVRLLVITNKQFERMDILIGKRTPEEEKITSDQLILL